MLLESGHEVVAAVADDVILSIPNETDQSLVHIWEQKY